MPVIDPAPGLDTDLPLVAGLYAEAITNDHVAKALVMNGQAAREHAIALCQAP